MKFTQKYYPACNSVCELHNQKGPAYSSGNLYSSTGIPLTSCVTEEGPSLF